MNNSSRLPRWFLLGWAGWLAVAASFPGPVSALAPRTLTQHREIQFDPTRPIPAEKVIVSRPWGHEEWFHSAHPQHPSLLARGEKPTLRDLYRRHAKEILGTEDPDQIELYGKLLSKWIHARIENNDEGRFSVQIHPPGAYELWIVRKVHPKGQLFLGLKDGFDAEAFREDVRKIHAGQGQADFDFAQKYMNAVKPNEGEVFLIGPGLLHAGFNVTIGEIKIEERTLRVWDWNRPVTPGRELTPLIELEKIMKDHNRFSQVNVAMEGVLLTQFRNSRMKRFNFDLRHAPFLVDLLPTRYGNSAVPVEDLSGVPHFLWAHEGLFKIISTEPGREAEQLAELGAGGSLLVPAAMGKYKVVPDNLNQGDVFLYRLNPAPMQVKTSASGRLPVVPPTVETSV